MVGEVKDGDCVYTESTTTNINQAYEKHQNLITF